MLGGSGHSTLGCSLRPKSRDLPAWDTHRNWDPRPSLSPGHHPESVAHGPTGRGTYGEARAAGSPGTNLEGCTEPQCSAALRHHSYRGQGWGREEGTPILQEGSRQQEFSSGNTRSPSATHAYVKHTELGTQSTARVLQLRPNRRAHAHTVCAQTPGNFSCRRRWAH